MLIMYAIFLAVFLAGCFQTGTFERVYVKKEWYNINSIDACRKKGCLLEKARLNDLKKKKALLLVCEPSLGAVECYEKKEPKN
jgi:hypothetical protein